MLQFRLMWQLRCNEWISHRNTTRKSITTKTYTQIWCTVIHSVFKKVITVGKYGTLRSIYFVAVFVLCTRIEQLMRQVQWTSIPDDTVCCHDYWIRGLNMYSIPFNCKLQCKSHYDQLYTPPLSHTHTYISCIVHDWMSCGCIVRQIEICRRIIADIGANNSSTSCDFFIPCVGNQPFHKKQSNHNNSQCILPGLYIVNIKR